MALLSFDIAGLELYLPLSVGGKVVIASREEAGDGSRLMQLLQNSKATVMQATPATWRLLLDSRWQGDSRLKVLCGGEALPFELAERLLPRCGELWNMYGPTETTIWSSVYRVQDLNWISAPIGKPIANTSWTPSAESAWSPPVAWPTSQSPRHLTLRSPLTPMRTIRHPEPAAAAKPPPTWALLSTPFSNGLTWSPTPTWKN